MQFSKVRHLALAAGVMLAPVVSFAADGDPDISKVTAAGATVALIGGAVFLVAVGIKVFKWAKTAL